MLDDFGIIILFVFIGMSVKLADDYLDELDNLNKGWLWSIVAGSLCVICVCQSVLAGVICASETFGCLLAGKVDRRALFCIPLGILLGWIIGFGLVWESGALVNLSIKWVPVCLLGSVVAQVCNDSKETSRKSRILPKLVSRHGLAGACLFCVILMEMPFVGVIWVLCYESSYGFTKMHFRREMGTGTSEKKIAEIRFKVSPTSSHKLGVSRRLSRLRRDSRFALLKHLRKF